MSETFETKNNQAYSLDKVAPDAKRGWNVLVNGEKVEGVESVSLLNEGLSMSIDYGMRPEGYDGFVIRELGGAVTIPWMMHESGQIYVGLVDEYRPTMGQEHTLNVPRGMAEADEHHDATAEREFKEETGKSIGNRAVRMASGINTNSTFFDNSREQHRGVSAYAVQLSAEELELDYDDEGKVFYKFPEDVASKAENKVVERIYGTKFVPIGEAFQSKDMFTVLSVGLLLGTISHGGDYILPQKLSPDVDGDSSPTPIALH